MMMLMSGCRGDRSTYNRECSLISATAMQAMEIRDQEHPVSEFVDDELVDDGFIYFESSQPPIPWLWQRTT